MLTPNCGCVGAPYKLTCSDIIFASLVGLDLVFCLYIDNRTTIIINLFDYINFVSGYNRD